MNLNTLTPEDIIRYIDNGVITQDIPIAVFIKTVEHMQDRIISLESELEEESMGYDRGWDDAVKKIQEKLDCM